MTKKKIKEWFEKHFRNYLFFEAFGMDDKWIVKALDSKRNFKGVVFEFPIEGTYGMVSENNYTIRDFKA